MTTLGPLSRKQEKAIEIDTKVGAYAVWTHLGHPLEPEYRAMHHFPVVAYNCISSLLPSRHELLILQSNNVARQILAAICPEYCHAEPETHILCIRSFRSLVFRKTKDGWYCRRLLVEETLSAPHLAGLIETICTDPGQLIGSNWFDGCNQPAGEAEDSELATIRATNPGCGWRCGSEQCVKLSLREEHDSDGEATGNMICDNCGAIYEADGRGGFIATVHVADSHLCCRCPAQQTD